MIVKINDQYIDTTQIVYVSKVYLYSGTGPKRYVFHIFLKNREKEILFGWSLKTYDGETEESLRQKIDAMRNKLARKMNSTVENLDAVIDLRKDTDNKPAVKKSAVKKA